jgi:hypothetical protein
VSQLEEVRQGRGEKDATREAPDELGASLREHIRLGDGDELRRRLVEPREQVAHLGHGQVLEAGVGARVLRFARHEELVIDVDVGGEAELLERGDGFACDVELERLVEEELTRSRVDDGGALVADDRFLDPCLLEVALDRAEHPARRDEDGDAGVLRPRDRGPKPRPEQPVSTDERPVEVARERRDLAGKAFRKRQV